MIKTRKIKKQQSPIRILTVCMLLILGGMVLILFSKLAEDRTVTYAYEYTDCLRQLQKGDYPEVGDMARYNYFRNAKPEKDTTEFLYFTGYYEASQLYLAYLDAGDSEKAEEQYKIMQENYQLITDKDILSACDELIENN